MRKKRDNSYAVTVKTPDSIVGHVPCTVSTLCHLFLSIDGSIICIPTDIRKYFGVFSSAPKFSFQKCMIFQKFPMHL